MKKWLLTLWPEYAFQKNGASGLSLTLLFDSLSWKRASSKALQRPPVMSNPATHILGTPSNRFVIEHNLSTDGGFEHLASLQHELQIQIHLGHPSGGCDYEAELLALVRSRQDFQHREERVVGERQLVGILRHRQPATRGHMNDVAADLFGHRGQLWLVLRVRARDDEAELFVKHAQVALSVEIPAARRGGRDQAGKAGQPRPAFADAGGHGHLVRVTRLVLRDRRGRTV